MPRVARSFKEAMKARGVSLAPGEEVWPCRHLHFGHPISRTMTAHVSAVLSHLFCSTCYDCSRKPRHWCFPFIPVQIEALWHVHRSAALGGGWLCLCPSVLPPVRPRGWVQISTSFAVRRALTCPWAQSKLDKLSHGLEKA